MLKFAPGLWIKGKVDGIDIVGRTLIYPNLDMELVGIVNINGELGHIEFSFVVGARVLSFIKPDELTQINKIKKGDKKIFSDNDITKDFDLNVSKKRRFTGFGKFNHLFILSNS